MRFEGKTAAQREAEAKEAREAKARERDEKAEEARDRRTRTAQGGEKQTKRRATARLLLKFGGPLIGLAVGLAVVWYYS